MSQGRPIPTHFLVANTSLRDGGPRIASVLSAHWAGRIYAILTRRLHALHERVQRTQSRPIDSDSDSDHFSMDELIPPLRYPR